MNYVTIMQTIQGLVQYLKNAYQNQQIAVVVGYDGRHYSRDFAEITTGILAYNKIKVYVTKECCPTPTVAYLTKHYKDAQLGVMITASHNPTIYNGFKVYGSDGIQIIEPTNQHIQEYILQNLTITKESYNYKQYLNSSYCIYITDQELNSYFEECKQLCYNHDNNQNINVNIQYSAMYGVGFKNVKKMAFEVFNFNEKNIKFFEKSTQVDPDFGGLSQPNPELNENMQMLADKALPQTQIIIATDPDSDRIAVSERQQDGKWYHFNGCEIGLILTQHQINHTTGDNRIIVSTTVSTHLYKQMAKQNNIDYRTTLTGFKWIARAGRDSGKKFIIGWEEAIGYTMSRDGDPIVLDKDGVSSTCVMIECADECYKQGKTLLQQLHQIYDKYGYYSYYQESTYYNTDDKMELQSFIPFIKDFNEREYRKYFGKNNEYKVVRIRDLKKPGYDSKYGKPLLPIGNNEMITFFIKSPQCEGDYDIIFTKRTSGTESKTKQYYEAISNISYNDAEQKRKQFMDVICELTNQYQY